jgi:hypothetical protein
MRDHSRSIWALFAAAFALGCGTDASRGSPATAPDGGTDGSGAQQADSGIPAAPPSDPCGSVGYRFDGSSDCSVVRCPKVTCECPPESGSATGETLTLTTCVPDRGCLTGIDCKRACDPAARATREVCQQRIAAAGSQRCHDDSDCTLGTCREESVGKICIDTLSCSENGHCGAGFECRMDPKATSPTTGACSSRKQGSVCYMDSDCAYGRCSGNRCNGGLEGETCTTSSQCQSGICRTGSTSTGSCVSGKPGTSCTEDAQCLSGLHCGGGTCASGSVGQPCETDGECDSKICALSLCRGGEPGSMCETDSDCLKGLCAGSYCTSGSVNAPCYEAADCKTGLRCARQVCTDGTKGSPCSADTDCSTIGCVRGACSDGTNGSVCDADDECQSKRCADPAGADPGECTSGAKGARCISASDCVSNSCTAAGSCA